MSTQAVEGLRWYTRARRIPRLVGKLPGSQRGLPFGPYTITQIVGAAACYLLLARTTGVWGRFGFLGNHAAQLTVTFAVLQGLRLVKPGGRDPLTAGTAALGVWAGPRYGRYRGRAVRPARPRSVTARAHVLLPAPVGPPPAAGNDRAADPPPRPHGEPTESRPPQVTGEPAHPTAGPAPLTTLDRLLPTPR